ncbi:uncharacterized protein LOC127096379 [Lathyrus oleraceus]|uniref:uncharacterized protein LOC127096379 n=1 Tax=Pisum sativum TaxID=3888 RepID=UPI0021D33CE2|nr:uncharacterized protein LOC127096379 [Pisum sativum]
MSYSHILPYLLQGSLVQLRELGPPPTVLPPNYDANARCEFHPSAPDHSIENYKALKYKVQDLINSKAITFASNGPNVNNNLMPPHNKSTINMVEFDNRRRFLSCVDELKTTLIEIKNILMKNNAFPVCSTTCEHCLINPQQCEALKSVVQKLMYQGILVIYRPSIIEEVSTLEITYNQVQPLLIPYDLSQMTISSSPIVPMVIIVPTTFPFNDMKAVPWVYDLAIYIHGQRMKKEPTISAEPIENMTGIGGVTRSGRIFAPMPPMTDNGGLSSQEKGTQMKNAQQRQDSLPTNELDEFVCIIKRSDYTVVDQLDQTLSKTSMLSLLMCSEAHCDALVKFLKASHVLQELSVCQFEGVANNRDTNMSLGFNDEELPTEERNHKKTLHISIECVDTILSRVLGDTDSSLNVIPKSSLSKLTIEGLEMKPNELVARAFDGSRRTVIGEVDLPIKIGPLTFFITFFMMDIYPAYNCLLGRTWIHSTGAITSTVHQRLKFLVNNKLVVMEGEEDIMASHLASFWYVEGE